MAKVEQPVRIKPHHLLDLIRDFGAGRVHEPHPYGHAVHLVAEMVRSNPGLPVELTSGADAICAPCRNLVGGRCTDSTRAPGYETSKETWNRLIDSRIFARLGLKENDRLFAHEFCKLAIERLGDIRTIYPEVDPENTAWRAKNLEKGLREYNEE
jgi:hypothetical protein